MRLPCASWLHICESTLPPSDTTTRPPTLRLNQPTPMLSCSPTLQRKGNKKEVKAANQERRKEKMPKHVKKRAVAKGSGKKK